ncbi:nitrite reductase [Nocardioides albidus]|uniref:Nitrite reductase n=1 Tax=Nocardioides albidus TaxID=1517589 RepID=A0A5C4WM38_9ACTN|nr:nitrite reductase [Nocardioides albidus]TNM48309.1 nitrite reductase [Nocardioides albidus]
MATRAQTARSRPDRCPGIVHPWPADDGGLVRVRVPGGQVRLDALRALAAVAQEYGDGRVRVTGRANLQVRAMPLDADGLLAAPALDALERTGLLPSRAHDRVRNVLASPQTGLAGGRADLRPVVARLDDLLLADAPLAALPGRFLFTLDDGRGDLADKHLDLGLVALDDARAQLCVGEAYGDVVALADAADALVELARSFLATRGTGPQAPWHVPELPEPLLAPVPPAPGATVTSGPLPFGEVAGGHHVAVPEDGLDLPAIASWTAATVVVTPWHGVLIPSTSEEIS